MIAAPPSGSVRDESLLDEIPPSVEVARLRGALGIRVPNALRALRLGRLYASFRHIVLAGDDGLVDLSETIALGVRMGRDVDAVVATSLPFSSIVAGALIARALNKPFLADLRDPWAFAPRVRGFSSVHLRAMKALERRTLAEATSIVTVTEGCRRYLSPEVAERAIVIPNGYDPADLEVEAEPRSDHAVRIVHAGSLYGERHPGLLLEALSRVQARYPERRIELVMAGATYEHASDLTRAAIRVDVRGYLSHRESMALVRSADAIVVLVGNQPEDDHALPAKLFEAIAMGPPVLCSARAGSESARLMEATGAGRVVSDRAAIEVAVEDLLEGRLETSNLAERAPVLAPFHRSAIARRFADLLDALVTSPRR